MVLHRGNISRKCCIEASVIDGYSRKRCNTRVHAHVAENCLENCNHESCEAVLQDP